MAKETKTWRDSRGTEVPIYAISPTDKAEEKHARKILKLAIAAEKALKTVREAIRLAYDEVIDLKIKEANFKSTTPPTFNSNTTINSFDGTIEVRITKPNAQYFDKAYTEMVKAKFDEYFSMLGDDSDVMFLRTLINDLMFTSTGNIDKSKVDIVRKRADSLSKNNKIDKKSQVFIDAVTLFNTALKTKAGNTGYYVDYRENSIDQKRSVALKISDV
jgi:hypothetical protein